MTLREFLHALKECPYGWEITSNCRVRTKGMCWCPIVAVANHKFGVMVGRPKREFSNGNWQRAAEYLGMSVDMAYPIVMAADGDVGHTKKMRDDLLATLNLELSL